MIRLGIVMLAAGASVRFGGGDKLLAEWKGRPLIEWSLHAASGLDLARKVLIVRAGRNFAELAKRYGYDIVLNLRAEEGMGASIALGAAEMADVDGVFIALGDMPRVPAAAYAALWQAFAQDPTRIVRPEAGGVPGHPVLFPKRLIEALRNLTGDEGARAIAAGEDMTLVPWPDTDVLADIDTRADLDRLS